MDGAGEHRDAVPADLVAEVQTGDADGTRASRTQDIHIQVVPLLRRGNAHRDETSAPVLVMVGCKFKKSGASLVTNAVATGRKRT